MISVVIPTYEMNGVGKTFLQNSLAYISQQTFKDFEVVVSDHSITDEIEETCNSFKELDINYIRNDQNRGSSSANLNNAILNSKYDIVKFLMQDEYLLSPDILLSISQIFSKEEIKWAITGCSYGEDVQNPRGTINPYYNDSIFNGYNTIGSPSAVTVRKTKDLELFDPNLIWLMDCDYYKRMYDKWGDPTIIPGFNIFVNQHRNQVTNLISSELKNKETQLMINKYS